MVEIGRAMVHFFSFKRHPSVSYPTTAHHPESKPGQTRGIPAVNNTTRSAAPPLDARPTGRRGDSRRLYVGHLGTAARLATPGGASGVSEYPAGPESACQFGKRYTTNRFLLHSSSVELFSCSAC